MPTLNPPVAGAWAVLSPSLLEYQATGPLVPGATETITVPGGPSGVVGSEGQHLAQTVTSQFTVAPGSTLRLQQLLAELGYLPAHVHAGIAGDVARPRRATTRWGRSPGAGRTSRSRSTSLWTPGTNNVITRGAVMNFESQNGLKTDGVAGPQVWTDLLADVQSGKGDALPWDYVLVSQSLPETATVYKDGVAVYSTPVNTGVRRGDHRERDLAGLRPLHGDDHERHQPRRLALRRPRHPLGELLPRRGRPARLRAGLTTAPPRATAASRCRSPTPRSSSR